MQPIDFWNPDGQPFQMQPFDNKQFARNGTNMFLVRSVDAIAPLTGLLIQISPTGKRTAGQEVVIDKVEGLMRSCA